MQHAIQSASPDVEADPHETDILTATNLTAEQVAVVKTLRFDQFSIAHSPVPADVTTACTPTVLATIAAHPELGGPARVAEMNVPRRVMQLIAIAHVISPILKLVGQNMLVLSALLAQDLSEALKVATSLLKTHPELLEEAFRDRGGVDAQASQGRQPYQAADGVTAERRNGSRNGGPRNEGHGPPLRHSMTATSVATTDKNARSRDLRSPPPRMFLTSWVHICQAANNNPRRSCASLLNRRRRPCPCGRISPPTAPKPPAARGSARRREPFCTLHATTNAPKAAKSAPLALAAAIDSADFPPPMRPAHRPSHAPPAGRGSASSEPRFLDRCTLFRARCSAAVPIPGLKVRHQRV